MHDSIWLGFLTPDAADLPEVPALTPLALPPPPHITPLQLGPVTTPPSSPPPVQGGDLDAAIRAYFTPDDYEAAWCIVRHEDASLDPNAHNPGYVLPSGARSEDSWGYWQINLLAHPFITVSQATDVDWATRYAAALRYNRGNWGDWAYSAVACGLPQDVL